MRTGRTPWHIDGQNPLACRRRQLQGCWRRILACRQTPSFWHIDGHSVGISTETIFFGMSTENFFCMSTETIFFACRRRQSCLACRREHFFACQRRQSPLACRREHFFACRRRQSFLHVDGDNLFCMSTETILFWHVDGDNPFGMSTVVLACRRVVSPGFQVIVEPRNLLGKSLPKCCGVPVHEVIPGDTGDGVLRWALAAGRLASGHPFQLRSLLPQCARGGGCGSGRRRLAPHLVFVLLSAAPLPTELWFDCRQHARLAAHGASSATAAMAATPSVTGRVRIVLRSLAIKRSPRF